VQFSELTRHLREAWEVPRDLALRRYPPFVTGGPLPAGHVPVFCIHSVEPESFQLKLDHLARNGYVTLSANEYLEVLAGRRSAPERAVVLTFDDGRASVRTVAWPLMRRYGMKGVVFVIPARVPSFAGPLPPTWDDVLAGQAKPESVTERERGPHALMSWEELAELAASGLFDLESHTLSHARIHIAPDVVGFLDPGQRLGFRPLEVPVLRDADRDLFASDAPLGAPLLRSLPRLAGRLRFFEDAPQRAGCIDAVHAEGPGFFDTPGWERRLRRLTPARLSGRFETPEQHEQALREELIAARRLMQERLSLACEQLCYPWHAVSPLAQRLAREAGYRAVYCGKVRGRSISLPGDDPLTIARVGEDYIELLPGKGRGSLLAVLTRKWRRRLREALPEGRSHDAAGL
jgi:hypothetical protein